MYILYIYIVSFWDSGLFSGAFAVSFRVSVLDSTPKLCRAEGRVSNFSLPAETSRAVCLGQKEIEDGHSQQYVSLIFHDTAIFKSGGGLEEA